jgi:hypothetical protein
MLSAAATLILMTAIATADSFHGERGEQLASEHGKPPVRPRNRRPETTEEQRTHLAQKLARALDSVRDKPLSDGEIVALTQLGKMKDERVRIRFVAEAIRAPETQWRFHNRAPFALHAAVGLDGQRRDIVERLLVERMENEEISREERIGLAFSLATLGDVNPKAALRAVVALTRVNADSSDIQNGSAVLALAPYLEREDLKRAATFLARDLIVQDLIALTPRLGQENATTLCGQVAVHRGHDVYRAVAANRLRVWGDEFSECAIRLERKLPVAAVVYSRTGTILYHLAQKTGQINLDRALADLDMIAPYLSAEDARKVADVLRLAMTEDLHPFELSDLTRTLAAVLSRLEPKEANERARQALGALQRALARATTADDRGFLVLAQLAIAQHLASQDAVATFAAVLSKVKEGTNDYLIVRYMAEWAARQRPRVGIAFLVEALSKTLSNNGRFEALMGLDDIVHHLDRQGANETAVILAKNPSALAGLRDLATEAIAARLDSAAAKEVVLGLVAAIADRRDDNLRNSLFYLMGVFTERLESKDANEVVAALTRAMKTTSNTSRLRDLAWGLANAAQRLPPKEGFAILLHSMKSTTDSEMLDSLASGLSKVAPHYDPKEAVKALTVAMNRTTSSYALANVAHGLVRTAAQVAPREGATILLNAMTDSNDAEAMRILADGLAQIAASLDAKYSARLCSEAAVTLEHAMNNTEDPIKLREFAHGLAAVSGRLDKKEATARCSQAATRLYKAMTQLAKIPASPPRHPSVQCNELWYLAQGLEAVAVHLETRDAASRCSQAATLLFDYMTKTREDTWYYFELNGGLQAVAAHLDPKDAREMAAALTQTLRVTSGGGALRDLARSLSVVASRMDSREGVTTLMQALNQTTRSEVLQPLAEGLSAIAPHLDRKEANAVRAQAILFLLRTLTRTTNDSDSERLTKGLATLLSLESSGQRFDRVRSLAVTVGLSTSPSAFPLVPAVISPASAPLPEPLPAQTLVALLKHPLCVGEARRLVLNALGSRYHCTFADQWDFVRFARREKLDLDLTAAPRLP